MAIDTSAAESSTVVQGEFQDANFHAAAPSVAEAAGANAQVQEPGVVSHPGNDAAVSPGASPEPKSMLEAMQAANRALESKGDSPTSGNHDDDGGQGASDAAGSGPGFDSGKAGADAQAREAEANDRNLPFHNHPRWKEVTTQNRTLRAENEQLKPDADRWRQLDDWTRQSHLAGQEVQTGLEIMSLMKNDPLEALEKLRPFYVALQRLAGEILPEDLNEKVNQGYIDQESATNLVRAQSQAQVQEQRFRGQSAQFQQQQELQRRAVLANAVNSWEAGVRSRDPEYARLQEFVYDRMSVLSANQRPGSADEAVALAQRAYDEVNAKFRSAAPRAAARELRPMTSHASSAAGKAEPKSLREAMELAQQGRY